MKLRNKVTGEVWDIGKILTNDYPSYDRLNDITEDFEDIQQPLIKDEKIRKAVRAWYDAIDYRIDNLLCIKTSGNTRLEISDGSPKLIYISLFVDKGTLANIKDRTYYTIAELCGEEEDAAV